jgi:bifunctional UDP-N-acetylglucosamine pyrophosphorylase / glucosamine-1-phosphate N-acetyltransferase
MSARPLSTVVLAAGEGTRMRSTRPKPLHLLCGRAMLLHILDAAARLDLERSVVVIGHGAERVTKKLTEDGPPGLAIDFVEQHVQRGTGDAVMVGLTAFPDDDDAAEGGDVLILPGDTPLLRSETLADLVAEHRETGAAATLLTARVPNPTGYGRIVRGRDDKVVRIVEEADADDEQKAIDEINTSIYCFRRSVLAPALRRTNPENAQGEYYLTDVIEVLASAGYTVRSLVAADPMETVGVNDRAQLAEAEAELRRRTNARWLAAGVTMLDPTDVYIDLGVRLGTDVTLFPGTILQGSTVVGERAEIGPDTRLVDCVVGADAVVTCTVGTDAEVGAGANVGPWAHLTAGSSISAGAVTGPFYTSADATSPDE